MSFLNFDKSFCVYKLLADKGSPAFWFFGDKHVPGFWKHAISENYVFLFGPRAPYKDFGVCMFGFKSDRGDLGGRAKLP